MAERSILRTEHNPVRLVRLCVCVCVSFHAKKSQNVFTNVFVETANIKEVIVHASELSVGHL